MTSEQTESNAMTIELTDAEVKFLLWVFRKLTFDIEGYQNAVVAAGIYERLKKLGRLVNLKKKLALTFN